MKKIKQYSVISIIFFIICLLGIILANNFFKINVTLCFILFGLFVVFYLIVFSSISNSIKQGNEDTIKTTSGNIPFILKETQIGLLKYTDDYSIASVSDMFISKKIDCVGEKLLAIFPEVEDMLDATSTKKRVVYNDYKFEVIKIPNSNVLIFKDITKEYNYEKERIENAYVLGFANFDNYDEANEKEDLIAFVNSNIKVPVIEYLKKYNVVYRTIRSNRLQIILNYKQLELLMKDRFSILDRAREESKKAGFDITLSMAFAYGSNDLNQLDDEAGSLLDLAQTRGGDQAIVRQVDKDPIYFGGSSEAREQKSKVKARVMCNTIRQQFKSASNVLIVGHKDSDCDCVGAMFGIAAFAKEYNEKTYVVIQDKKLEKIAAEVLDRYNDSIENDFNLINEDEALSMNDNNSLIIMCDHHSLDQTNSEKLIKEAKRIIVVDHHRRKADLEYNAVLLYLEASASSTCELVSEFIEFDKKIDIPEYLANMMYLGIIIDTNHFKARVNSRSFEAAARLKDIGADSTLCEELSQEPFDLVKTKTEIMKHGKEYDNGIIIAEIEDGEYTRTLASQACDALVETKGTKAAFVICKINDEDTIVSARSNGEVNVQVILEGMNGGGHMTAAGLQRKKESVKDIKKELIENIDKYFNESEEKDESNITE